jgi:hypothetical protein
VTTAALNFFALDEDHTVRDRRAGHGVDDRAAHGKLRLQRHRQRCNRQ